MKTELKEAVLHIVSQIPQGKVMFYGQIADMVGSEARTIGFILTGLSEPEMQTVPWYRVVAKDGYISSFKLGEKGIFQRQLLEQENYEIDPKNKVNMNIHLWLFAGIQRLEDKVEPYETFIEGLKR